ncbi:MAG: WD40 repeat domain-containing protein [Epsilonproteobacteria bacterium]|nr:WD40 repeat domain-containing protein [Campylobacterota bacterium]
MVRLLLLMGIGLQFLFGIQLSQRGYFKRSIEVATTNGQIVVIGRNGKVEIRDFRNLSRLIKVIPLPKIHGFARNILIPMPFYDIDVTPSGKILILGKGDVSNRRLLMIEKGKIKFFLKSNLFFIQAQFITPTKIVAMTNTGELVGVDIQTRKVLWDWKTGLKPPTRMALNYDRSKVAIVGADGATYIFNSLTGKVVDSFRSLNRRESLSLSYYSRLIMNGSFDGKVVVFDIPTRHFVYIKRLARKIYYQNNPPLPTATAILGDRTIAYTYQHRNIYLYDLKTKKGLVLKGDQYPITKLQFIGIYLISYTPHSISIWR